MIKKSISFIIAMLLLLSCADSNNSSSFNPVLIAHAGGAVDGASMTNSLEAICAARDKGYKYIELDLCLTADSNLVAVHDWEEYNRAMGMEAKGDSAPTLSAFLSQKLPSGHTPLSAACINGFFLSHDSLHLVTDKISDPAILEKFFPRLKERMIVETFSYDHYSSLLEKGYEYVTYSCLANDIPSATLKHILFSWLFPGVKIKNLALHTSAFDYAYMKFLLLVSDYEISLFTVNDYEAIPERALQGLRYIYTDSLLP